MKKLFGFFALAGAAAVALASCGSSDPAKTTTANNNGGDNGGNNGGSSDSGKKVKAGFIFLHDDSSSYDKNFLDAAKDVCDELGVEYVLKTNIEEGAACYDAAADLADAGCDVVFADSFGHEKYLAQAAQEFPTVEFCHATGTTAHTAGLNNLHNAFAAIYEGRYCTGIAAGMKLNEMIEAGTITTAQAKLGYVGAYTYAEVISGYTSFYLGAKSVCPSVTMDVKFTGSWYDLTAEKNVANDLIAAGAKVISQHADSAGAPSACQEANVPNVFYNGENKTLSTYMIASRINWRPYFKYMINCVKTGTAIAKDYVGTIADGSVEVFAATATAAEGTQAAIDAAIAQFKAGTLNVFDTNNFTVGGEKKTSYLADVDTDAAYTGDTEVIVDGIFKESKFRSAPYFDLRIDGITLLNDAY